MCRCVEYIFLLSFFSSLSPVNSPQSTVCMLVCVLSVKRQQMFFLLIHFSVAFDNSSLSTTATDHKWMKKKNDHERGDTSALSAPNEYPIEKFSWEREKKWVWWQGHSEFP